MKITTTAVQVGRRNKKRQLQRDRRYYAWYCQWIHGTHDREAAEEARAKLLTRVARISNATVRSGLYHRDGETVGAHIRRSWEWTSAAYLVVHCKLEKGWYDRSKGRSFIGWVRDQTLFAFRHELRRDAVNRRRCRPDAALTLVPKRARRGEDDLDNRVSSRLLGETVVGEVSAIADGKVRQAVAMLLCDSDETVVSVAEKLNVHRTTLTRRLARTTSRLRRKLNRIVGDAPEAMTDNPRQLAADIQSRMSLCLP